MGGKKVAQTCGAGRSILEVKKIFAAGTDVGNTGGNQLLHMAAVRVHHIHGIAIVGVGEIDLSVVFTEHAAVVKIAGGIAHGAFGNGGNAVA